MTGAQEMLKLEEKLNKCREWNLLSSWLTDRECKLAETALRESALSRNEVVTKRMI